MIHKLDGALNMGLIQPDTKRKKSKPNFSRAQPPAEMELATEPQYEHEKNLTNEICTAE